MINDQAYNCLIHFYKRFQIIALLPGPIVDLHKSLLSEDKGAASSLPVLGERSKALNHGSDA